MRSPLDVSGLCKGEGAGTRLKYITLLEYNSERVNWLKRGKFVMKQISPFLIFLNQHSYIFFLILATGISSCSLYFAIVLLAIG